MRLNESNTYLLDLKKAVPENGFEFLKNKTILITGGTGLIGSALVDLIMMGNMCYLTNTTVVLASRNKEKVLNRYGSSKSIVWV